MKSKAAIQYPLAMGSKHKVVPIAVKRTCPDCNREIRGFGQQVNKVLYCTKCGQSHSKGKIESGPDTIPAPGPKLFVSGCRCTKRN